MPAFEPSRGNGGRRFDCPDSIIVDYNLGRIVGLYLAEGHIKLQHKSPNRPCLISFAVHRRETERTIEWLLPFNEYFSSVKINHREDCLTTEVNVYGGRFAALLYQLCGRVETKKFPTDWRRLGEDFCRGMLHGYISGDGHSDPNDRTIRASSIRNSLTVTSRDIMASLGYGWAAISYREGAIRRGRHEKAQYTLKLCGDGATKLAKELGMPYRERERAKVTSNKNYASHTIEINNGYAWLRIKSIEEAGVKNVYDFEIDHEDHSFCTIHGASHNSETAFSSNTVDHTTGILQAVPNSVGTEVILESTANGVGNFFHQQWQDAEAGLSEYIPIFIPWYWQDEYKQPIIGILVPTIEEEELQQHYGLTLEQLNWRRNKIVQLSVNGQDGIKAFCQEYPSCATEAFILTGEDNYIPSDVILSARKAQGVEKIGSMVLGVDPARFGDDRTCIIRRCGRLAYKLESHIKLDTMQVAGLVKTIIENERPAKVCIDVGGLGAGVVDRLRELGFADIIVAVNFGATPYDASKYRNRKSEMWGLLKEWLLDGPVMIPDSDELHADLSGVKYAVDSNSRLVIESKESMKKRGVRSCDTADSLCLTFSVPNSALNASIRAKEAETLHQLRSSSQKTKQLLERSRYS